MSETGRLPLSFGQEQLWFLDQLSPEEATYNLSGAHRVRGPLDVDLLRECLGAVVARHAALRATFGTDDGVPYQVIAEPGVVDLPVDDLTGLPADERETAALHGVRAEAATPFDLVIGPLFRFRLWRIGEHDHVFFAAFHHIVTDGWSTGLVYAELAELYSARVEGREPAPAEPDMTFAEHVRDQRDRLRGVALEEELAYWEGQLAGVPVLELPTDRLRQPTPSNAGDTVSHTFDPDLVRDVRAFAQEQGVSLFMVLNAALTTVLHRYTGQDDIPVGVPMLGRLEPEQESVVGLFVNMVVLRMDLTGDPSFADLLERTADANLDIYDHQEVPFETVVQRVQPVRDPSRNPLFQVSVQVLDDSGAGLGFAGATTEAVVLPNTRAMFDLVVNFFQGPKGLRADITYAIELFDRERVEEFAGHIGQVLASVVRDSSVPLSRIGMLTDAERARLLDAGRGEQVTYSDAPLHDTIAGFAATTPDALAAVCRGRELTYAELDERATALARHLAGRGVRGGQIVAIAMDRDLDTLVAMVGVLKSGAAFTMMDPSHPASRLEYVLRDTAAPLVIARAADEAALPERAGWEVLLLDSGWDAIATDPAATDPDPVDQDALAYVLYTSGSTGKPKGVLIEHRALRCFAEAYHRSFDLTPADRLLQLPALTFDMSMGEIFTALTLGASLVLVSPEEGGEPDLLAELMRTQRATYAGLSPAILSVLDAEPYPDLKYVMSGADAVPAEMVNKWNLPGRQFLDLYGPTEATVACTEYLCEHKEWTTNPPIGHPELNRLVYVVDQWGNLVPRGVPGELLIGGDEGLARGYLNQPELTAEKFVPDPFRDTGRVYRSGDLVRWRADYELEFLGRIDNQVKLRGLRIELGEIESVLLAHPHVRMAVVLLGADSRGEKRLVGYYTATTDDPPSPADLERHLGAQLPEYMVPTAWVALDEFPLTTARKIDRKALPEPADDVDERAFTAPRTPTEARVAETFAEVLSLERVGADESFFDLGGNSLQAMRVVSRINKAFGVKINVRLLYGSSTVGAVAERIDGMAAPEAPRG